MLLLLKSHMLTYRLCSADCVLLPLLLQHPDTAGDWQASTLGVAYDWSTGKLSSYRYSWQKAVAPLEGPPEDLARVLLPAVTPPGRDR
jgi:hypothetical protein